ncbi:MAG: hypothetical protein GVY17_14355 [Cyanobacteria bacterium]|jgi:hypothetical protein|nr:hypothetical protein [Cyanobacteria bacterium GSL.Bin21]
MKFCEDSPNIPDKLLIARDEGRVVFFCGAGVSMARAGLPSFFGLTKQVIKELKVQSDELAYEKLNEVKQGIGSADQVFGALEGEFSAYNRQRSVAGALKPSPNPDLSCHQALLNLATTCEGKVQLVTTNFDRLFKECNPNLDIWYPPNLPDPLQEQQMDGIVHLHGCVDENYHQAVGDGFILSSSEFGRAYLAEKWATEFIQNILSQYVVVFVGYRAEDPPIRYLLEALRNQPENIKGIYAFQSGNQDELVAQWKPKGVTVIPYQTYPDGDKHRALWNTLEAWAERAKSPKRWYQSVINGLAQRQPQELQPYQRSQVAHVISTLEGAQEFPNDKATPPPAEWLCVFDCELRVSSPPEEYGLSTDSQINQSQTWDAFELTEKEQPPFEREYFSVIRGKESINAQKLPPRLFCIGLWITNVADQPACVWWAARQGGLHPQIQNQIKQKLNSTHDIPLVIRRAWQYLFQVWAENRPNPQRDRPKLKQLIAKEGWNRRIVKQYTNFHRPYLSVRSSNWNRYQPPKNSLTLRLTEILEVKVEYPIFNSHDIPQEHVAFAVRELRKNLEEALYLETEIYELTGGFGTRLNHISPLHPDHSAHGQPTERDHGLSGYVVRFSSLFERLIEIDKATAQHEARSWLPEDNNIFDKLRIWAFGKSNLFSAHEFGEVISNLSNKFFWHACARRDLLLVLARRWDELPQYIQQKIENRLLKGPEQWESGKDISVQYYGAYKLLTYLTDLHNQGCQFNFDWDQEIKELRAIAPDWNPENAESATESLEARFGYVSTDSDHSHLLDIPLSSILGKASEARQNRKHPFEEKDPFKGLSEEQPVRAFSALRLAAKHDNYPQQDWEIFLAAEARKRDKPKFSALIAERICTYPQQHLVPFLGYLTEWALEVSENLSLHYPESFDKLISKLIEGLSSPSSLKTRILSSNRRPDWIMQAMNAPAGDIATALFNDPRCKEFHPSWLTHVESLLAFQNEIRYYALVIFTRNLNYFFSFRITADWSKRNLLSVLNKDDDESRNAFWNGFLSSQTIPISTLYPCLKTELLQLVKKLDSLEHSAQHQLVVIICSGWISVNPETGMRFVSNSEMHNAIRDSDKNFRLQILWQIKSAINKNQNDERTKWIDRAIELFRDVWPPRIWLNTPAISAKICEIAFLSRDRFPQMVEVISPLITVVYKDFLSSFNPLESQSELKHLASTYPNEMLKLLQIIFPEHYEEELDNLRGK